MHHLYLASTSPRRKEILSSMGLSFMTTAPDVNESVHPDEPAEDYVIRMARAKACAGFEQALEPLPVLAADTIVVLGQKILGKPSSREDALDMLGLLSGQEHLVQTSVCVRNAASEEVALSVTRVRFRRLSDEDKTLYLTSGEPLDKAGAYGIQGLGALFVERIEGSYSGVVGLPIFETGALLAKFGIDALRISQGSNS